MIIIYEATETAFTSLGLGVLAPASCIISEDLNGQYELEMDHPIDDDGKWARIANDRIIKAPTHDGDQFFRIYKAVKNPITGHINVTAQHIFYDLLDNLLEDTRPTVKTGQEAGDIILAGCQYGTPFSFTSNISGVSTAYYIRVNPVQAMIGAIDQSFITRWGGEIRRNNFAISINSRRGSNKGVRIAYGKNLTGLNATEDISSLYTRIIPTALNEDNVVFYTDAKYYNSSLIGNYSHPKIGVLSTGIRVGELVDGSIPYPTVSSAKIAMAAMAAAAFAAGADKPKLTINVSFIKWQDTDEYKAYKDLYTLELGDDITVEYAPLSLTYSLRVISIAWDAVLNKALELTLGDFKPNFVQSVVSTDINLSALKNDVAGALQEGEVYNGCYVNHTDGFVTIGTVNGKTIQVKHNSQEGLSIYIDGVQKGGIMPIGSDVGFVGNILTNALGADCYATIGNITVSGYGTTNGMLIYNKNVSTSVPTLAIIVLDNGGIVIVKPNNLARIEIGSDGSFYFTDASGRIRIRANNTDTHLSSPSGGGNLFVNNTSVSFSAAGNSGGVDSGGLYKNIGGTKTYL